MEMGKAEGFGLGGFFFSSGDKETICSICPTSGSSSLINTCSSRNPIIPVALFRITMSCALLGSGNNT